MTKILHAAPIRENAIKELAQQCADLTKEGRTPFLKIFLVGDDPASQVYTNSKKRFSESIGAKCEILKLDKDISADEFLSVLDSEISPKEVHGCLIQLPLPKQLSHLEVDRLIPPEKDVDGFHAENLRVLYNGSLGEDDLIPCTPKGIASIFRHFNFDIEGKNVVVIGRSKIVGKPLSLLLSNYNATVTLCHSKTTNLKEHTQKADIIVTAIGKPLFLTKDYIGNNKPIVIDVGINRTKDNKLCGDCDFENIKDLTKAITPVPGGVGPLTIVNLAKNLITAATRQK